MLTGFREALQAQLADALGIPFKPGMLEGPIENMPALGCCWISRVNEVSGRVADEQIEARVRVYKRYEQQIDAETPIDPSPLEAYVEALQASVQAAQTGLGPWYQRLTAAQIDPATQGVEVTIVAWARNAGNAGG